MKWKNKPYLIQTTSKVKYSYGDYLIGSHFNPQKKQPAKIINKPIKEYPIKTSTLKTPPIKEPPINLLITDEEEEFIFI